MIPPGYKQCPACGEWGPPSKCPFCIERPSDMTHTQHAAIAIAAQLPPDVPRGGALDGLITEIVAELVAWLKSKCFKSPEKAYAYLAFEDYYWFDPWGSREDGRQKTINRVIEVVAARRFFTNGGRADVVQAVRAALAANLTLPMLRGLYEECP